MPANRPAIPSELDRRVRVEAGHRCAIPVCRVPVIEIAHIRPWAKVKRHEFENLIALCPTCHTLFDRGHIDRLAMVQYKANLSPFSPYALAAHPYHADFLAAYQKFRVFIEMWLTGALAFRGAKQRGATTSELQRNFQGIGDTATEASYARLYFAAASPSEVTKLADQIFYVTVRHACKLLNRPVPTAFPETGPAFDDLPAMWADLHHEIHEVLNKPAPRVVKVVPRSPILADEVIRQNE
ncbi:HNH endonuclease [Streptomyces sp. NPDC048612]|uniref:HNH endonuclease n=1 Tax=Streptomyces sp. NPDC048612 TaxID=3365579 RepID=UPI003716E95E